MHGIDARRRAPATQTAWILERYLAGDTIYEIAEAIGVSAEAVRQRILRWGPRNARQRADAARRRRRARKAGGDGAGERAQPELPAITCPICGRSAPRRDRRSRTCGERACVEAWEAARYHLDPEADLRRRRSTARSILRHPEKHTQRDITWALAVLSDDPPPPNRRFTLPGSRAARALERARGARAR